MTSSLGQGILELVYPPVCHLCDSSQPIGVAHAICQACVKQLRQLRGPQCRRCAASFPHVDEHALDCPFCRDEDYAFQNTLAWGSYQLSLRTVILKLKELRSESLAYHVGRLFACELKTPLLSSGVDVVVSVPLHWTRRFWRGYNQSEVLAQAIALELGKPYRSGWLWRRMRTPPQASVTPAQRRKNLRQSMAARIPKKHQGSHILLVDDVMTTGATADACARALLAAGAGSIRVGVLGRAVGETALQDATLTT